MHFVVVAVLIACGALLTFKLMGEEYSEWTVIGFFATVFFAFIWGASRLSETSGCGK